VPKRLSASALWLSFAAATIAGVALISVAFISLAGYKRSANATLDAAQTYTVEAALFTTMLDAESGVRAYVLTGDEAFLSKFEGAKTSLPKSLDALAARTADDASQEAEVTALRGLVDQRLALLQEAVDLNRAGDAAAAREAIASRRGADVTEAVRGALVRILAVESQQHTFARNRAGDRERNARIALTALSVLTAGALVSVFIALRRRGREQALIESGKAKDELLGMVSHELRTPLTVILGNASYLQRHWEHADAESRASSLREIEVEGDRLQRVVENMLALSRIERGVVVEPEPVLLRHVVEAVVDRHHSHYPGSKVDVRTRGDIPPVLGVEAYLDQVLQNLLTNAVKYDRSGAPIEVEVAPGEGTVEVSVMDRGPGIPPERAGAVFEPFVRLDATAGSSEGAGLGLPVCRRLMQAQGGDISVRPREGGGSCFTFTLKAVADEAPEAVAQQNALVS